MGMTSRRDFIQFSVLLGAVTPVSPTPVPVSQTPVPVSPTAVNPQLAKTAERVTGEFAAGVESLAAAIQNAGEKGLVTSEASPGLRSEISQIGQLLESAMKEATSQAARASKEAEEKTASAKVLSVIVCVVLVVVAIVVAVLTFAASSSLIVAAVAAASAIIGSAKAAADQRDPLNGAQMGAMIGAALVALTAGFAALQNLGKATEADKVRVRRLGLTELISAVSRLKGSLSSLSRVTGTCGADIRLISGSCQRLDQTLKSLTAYLRRLRLSSGPDGQAMIEALERVQRAFADATASLQK